MSCPAWCTEHVEFAPGDESHSTDVELLNQRLTIFQACDESAEITVLPDGAGSSLPLAELNRAAEQLTHLTETVFSTSASESEQKRLPMGGDHPSWCNAHFALSPDPDDSVHFGKFPTGVEGFAVTVEEALSVSGQVPTRELRTSLIADVEVPLTLADLREIAKGLIYAANLLDSTGRGDVA